MEKVVNARSAGAKAVLVFNEGQTGRTGPGTSATARFASQTYPGLPAAGLSYAAGKELYDAAQLGPVTVRLKTDVNINQRIDYDVIAETPGGDPNRILMVGAHIDGVNAGPGINDDGSGTAMNLAIAHQLMQQGMTPKYKIRFGWFSGEEQGLFGSQFYVNTLNTLETSRILGMLDYDMIASTNFIPFVYTDGATVPSAETILGGLHIDYLKQRLEHRQHAVHLRQPLRLRRLPHPRRPRDRPLHGRRDGQDGRRTWPSTAARSASRPTRVTTSGATPCSTCPSSA